MSYVVYNPRNPEDESNILTFDKDYVDNETGSKSEYEVGDTVAIKSEGYKYNGRIGVVVFVAYRFYRVELYNDSYQNNPRNLTKLGLFSHNELVKVAKPVGASTVYVPLEVNTLGSISNEELVVLAKGNKKEKSEVDDLRAAFSGGSQVVTKVSNLKSKAKVKKNG